MRTVSVKPSPEARKRARGLVVDLCEVEVGTANLFGHLDIAHLIGPVDPAGNDDSTLVIEFDSLQRLVQTLTATTQTPPVARNVGGRPGGWHRAADTATACTPKANYRCHLRRRRRFLETPMVLPRKSLGDVPLAIAAVKVLAIGTLLRMESWRDDQ